MVKHVSAPAGPAFSLGRLMPFPRTVSYIMMQIALASGALILTLSAVIWLTQSLRFIDWMVNRGLSVSVFLYLAVLVMPNFLVVILPIALFAAVLFTYNKLQTDSELVVMRAVGMGPWRLMSPALVVAVIATLFGYLLTLYLLPTSYRAFKDLQFAMRSAYSGILLQEGVFTGLDQGLTIFIRERSPDGTLRDIMMSDSRDPGKTVTITAESGALVNAADGPRIILSKGNRQELDEKTGRVSFLFFDRYTLDIVRTANAPEESRNRIATERFIDDLFNPEDVTDPRTISTLRAEGHQRLVSPLYIPCFVMVALAALLSGNYSRRGQGYRVMAAIAIVVSIQALGISLMNLAGKSPEIVPLMYLNVAIPMIIAAFVVNAAPARTKPDRRRFPRGRFA